MNVQRFELEGELTGRHVLIDLDACTMGALEDMQSGTVGKVLDVFAALVFGGNMPGLALEQERSYLSDDRTALVRACLRGLKQKELKALDGAITAAFRNA